MKSLVGGGCPLHLRSCLDIYPVVHDVDAKPADGFHSPLRPILPPVDRCRYGTENIRHYKNREFEDAVDYYTMALHYCPEGEEHNKDRAVYLANRAQGHLQLEEVSGGRRGRAHLLAGTRATHRQIVCSPLGSVSGGSLDY